MKPAVGPAMTALLQRLTLQSTEERSRSALVVAQLSMQVEALAEILQQRDAQQREFIQALYRRPEIRAARRLAAARSRLATRLRPSRGAAGATGPAPPLVASGNAPSSDRARDPGTVADQVSRRFSSRLMRGVGESGEVGGLDANLELLREAVDGGHRELADALARVFVVAYPRVVTADWTTAFLSAMRVHSSRAVPSALVPAARRAWPDHVGVAFEAAALADHSGDRDAAAHAWETVIGLVDEQNDPEILATARQRLSELVAAGVAGDISLTNLFDPTNNDDYHHWLSQHEDHSIDAYRGWLDKNPDTSQGPTFSIVMPVYEPDVTHLSAAVRSVLGQWYPNWQLVLSDDASSSDWVLDEAIAQLLADSRIVIVRAATNGGISAATNRAIEATAGAWVAFMDQDDLLAPDALAQIADMIATRPEARLIFSDEDKVDEYGRRSAPYFKPEAVRELLLGQNVISHLAVYARDIITSSDATPLLRSALDGSQDWDLNLRVVEGLRDDEIVHVPRILYHWRQTEKSFSQTRAHVAHQADARAVAESLKRRGLVGVARPVAGGGWFQIHLRTGQDKPRASVIIPTRDHPELIRQCLASVLDFTDYPLFEIIVVDNGTRDPRALAVLEDASRDDRVTVLKMDEPFNFSRLLNAGVGAATGDVVVSLNNDVTVHQADWLDQLVANAMRSGIGAVGVKLIYPNRTVQHAGVLMGLGGVAGHSFVGLSPADPGYFGQAVLTREVEGVTGAVLAIRRDTYREVGGFDEHNLAVTYNDVDFCLRLRERGLKNLVLAGVELTHLESESRGSDEVPERQETFRRECQYMVDRWGDELGMIIDRIKNPNFSQRYGDNFLERSSSP